MDQPAYELRDTLLTPTASCPICHLALRSVSRYLSALAYDQVSDLQVRAALRTARGFCNPHAYRWLREARSVLGTALIYRDIVLAATAALPAQAPRKPGRLTRLLARPDAAARPPGPCLACREQQDAEARYLGALPAVLADPELRQHFAAGPGFCLPHAEAAIAAGGDSADLVLTLTRERAALLVATLDEVIRKEDYRFRHEPRTDAERVAPPTVVAWVRGADGLVEP